MSILTFKVPSKYTDEQPTSNENVEKGELRIDSETNVYTQRICGAKALQQINKKINKKKKSILCEKLAFEKKKTAFKEITTTESKLWTRQNYYKTFGSEPAKTKNKIKLKILIPKSDLPAAYLEKV